MIKGYVRLVESQRRGAVIVGWSGNRMEVASLAALPRDGGTLLLEDGQTTVGYLDAVEGAAEDDPDVLVTATVAPPDWGGDEVWAQLMPEAVDVVASVATETGEIAAVVPHALRPLLAEGIREVDPELVSIDLSADPVIHDVIGRRAEVGMEGLSREVRTAITGASGATVIHATSEPDRDGEHVGDTWFRHTDSGSTLGMWHWNGSRWAPMTLSNEVVGNLDAGKITSGVLSGVDIYSPSPEVTPRVHVGSSTVEVVRSDGDGQEITTVSLGGPDTDRMVLSDRDGNPIAGFEQDGSLLANSASINGPLTIGGDDIMDLLGSLPQGVVARQKLGSTSRLNAITYGSSSLGLLELQVPMTAGRVYRFGVSGMAWSGGAGRLVFMVRMTTDGTAPTISSPRVAMASFATDGATHVESALILPVQSADVTARILLTAQQQTSSGGGHLLADDTYPFDIYIEDMGTYPSWGDGTVNTGGGTPLQGATVTPAAPAVTTKTSTWHAAAFRSWRGSETRPDCLPQGNYGGYQYYSVALWPAAVARELGSNSVTIQRMEMYLRNRSWYWSAGGRARIGHYNSSSLPGSPQTSGGGAFTSSPWKPGAGMWVAIPKGWWPGVAWGTIRGFTLGEGAGTDKTYYGKFSSALSDIRLRITYTK